MLKLILLSLSVIYLLLVEIQYVSAQGVGTPGQAPIGGKAVYIEKSNSLWIFSFAKSLPTSGNKLFYIDLNQSFNTINPPV